MYEAHWHLKMKPFENTPDPRFLFASAQHEEGLSRLLYAVRETKGAAMLTGVFGCGKTLLGTMLEEELGRNTYRVAYLAHPQLDGLEFLMAIVQKLGGDGLPTKRTEILKHAVIENLERALLDHARDGKKTVIVVDEAHVIQDRVVWEELRTLLNFQTREKFLITLLLLGQPELRGLVEGNQPLAQRIGLRYHLVPLSSEETPKYIEHRLKVAGGTNPFTPAAAARVHEAAGGIPRRINQICDLALVAGFAQKVQQIDEGMVREAAQDVEAAA